MITRSMMFFGLFFNFICASFFTIALVAFINFTCEQMYFNVFMTLCFKITNSAFKGVGVLFSHMNFHSFVGFTYKITIHQHLIILTVKLLLFGGVQLFGPFLVAQSAGGMVSTFSKSAVWFYQKRYIILTHYFVFDNLSFPFSISNFELFVICLVKTCYSIFVAIQNVTM